MAPRHPRLHHTTGDDGKRRAQRGRRTPSRFALAPGRIEGRGGAIGLDGLTHDVAAGNRGLRTPMTAIMPYIELSRVCGESAYRGRFLEYHVRRTRPRRWSLEVRINVAYRWAFENAGKWDEGRKATFRAALARHARRTWSGRFVLRNGDPDDGGSVGVDVSLEVVEKWHRAADTWQIVVYPERADRREPDRPEGFSETSQPIRCAPRWTGWPDDLPRPVRPQDRLHHAGVCFLYERSVTVARVREDDPRRQRASDHEVGHMLGMAHPGGICSEDDCYGHDDARDRIMGMGMRVTRDDYAFATGIMHHYSNAPHGRRRWWVSSR